MVGFSMEKVPMAKRAPQQETNGGATRKIRKVGDLVAANKREVCPALIIKPPDRVLSYLHQLPVVQVIGLDVETHDWVCETNKKGEYGSLGFYTLTTPEELLYKRMVQIGWAIGKIECVAGEFHSTLEFTSVKERKIQPDGFQISEKATNYHGITNECAAREGVPLASALKEFITDVISVCSNQGRAISHHMHHDAMIIMHELERAGMNDMVATWKSIARSGVCTMDPCIGKWVYAITKRIGCATDCTSATAAQGATLHQQDSWKPTLPLQQMVEWLVPGQDDWEQRAHAAGADAEMHCLVYYELMKLANRASE